MNNADEQLRETMLEAYELSVTLRGLLDTTAPQSENILVARRDLERVAQITPLIAGFGLAAVPMARFKQLVDTVIKADSHACIATLALLLDRIDYTQNACAPDEPIGKVLPVEHLVEARTTLHKRKAC
ncbi:MULTISPECIES: hypothetical protein [unclassified Caballeronia]|jgi:hypothetical protein|uniref:hypothetical protein n=1 Tax=unclassified Caballeronia TaxID=2646786 RepID=UPI0020296D39|nr:MULTISPECIES: hypothetical protein [unclassified Caballeronia]